MSVAESARVFVPDLRRHGTVIFLIHDDQGPYAATVRLDEAVDGRFFATIALENLELSLETADG